MIEKLKYRFQTNNQMQKQRGQSMVELAISFTMLMFIFSATVDMGRMFYAYIAIRDAAQEGAAYGSLNPTDSAGIGEHVRTSSTDPFDLTDVSSVNISVKIMPEGAPACAGNGILVVVTYDLNFFMPLITLIVPSGEILLTANMLDTIIAPPCP